MDVIETWWIVLGLINLILFLISLAVFIPKKVYKTSYQEFYLVFRAHLPYLFIIFGVVFFHLIEVNIIDPAVTAWVGIDFASVLQSFEGDAVFWFSQHWTPVLVYFFVFIYIGVHPFMLWFSPFYFFVADEKKSMKTYSYGLLLIYMVALPFYLLMPITNVYKYYGLESALETVIPTVEQFFYATTTQNNCLPSLHVAMSILIAWSIRLTGNKRLTFFAFFYMVCVIISVIYLAIHWITDVICGMTLAIMVIFVLNRFILGDELNDSK